MKAPICLDAEVRAVPGFPGISVTKDGRLFGPRGPRRTSFLRNGYEKITVRPGVNPSEILYVHRAVLLAWEGPCPEGMEACHLDGVRSHNVLENLKWGTRSENHGHKRLHGTAGIGERNPNAKLTEAEVREIRTLWPSRSVSSLGRQYGVSRGAIRLVVKRINWRSVS